MRIPRFVLALLLIGTPVATVAVTATSAAANPFTYAQVSIGWGNLCALTTSHQVLCLGDNYDRTLIGTSTERTIRVFTPVPLPNGEEWSTIDAGPYSTHCGLATSGRAFCWGDHSTGSYFNPSSRTPVQVEFPNDARVKEVHAGYSTACAIDLNDDLWCWGDPNLIGNGDTEPVRIPVRVPMPDNSKITSLDMHSNVCVTTNSHRAYCWGSNSNGELGIGYAQQTPTPFSWTPVLLPAPNGKYWTSVAPMGGRICAIANDGTGYCAGNNYNGSFGNGTYANSYNFTQMTVPNNDSLSSIIGGLYHSCVTTTSGTFYCFGEGSSGQLGTGTSLGGKTYRTWYLAQPVNFTSRTSSISGTCGIDTDAHIWCTSYIASFLPPNPNDPSNLFPRQLPDFGTPTVSAPNTSNIGSETVSLSGVVNSNGYMTTAALELSSNSSFTEASRYALNVNGADGSYSDASYSLSINDVVPRTSYYARVIATNSLGRTTSSVTTFTTLGSEPVVSEVSASNITGNEATAQFIVNPGRLATTISAEFSTDVNFQNDLMSFPTGSATGNLDVIRSVNLTGLQPRTRYYARAIATNRLGTTVGTSRSFLTTGSAPSVTTFTTSAFIRSVVVNAVIATGNASGSVYAEASTTSNFATVLTSNTSTFTSTSPTNHQVTITGMQPRTDYFVRVIVTNQIETKTSIATTTRTLGGAPTVATPTVQAYARGATFQLQFDANGLDTAVRLLFSTKNGIDDPYELFIRQSDTFGSQDVSFTLEDLRPGMTYEVALIARNDAGTATSSTVTFTTPGPLGVIINGDDYATESATVDLTITPPVGAVAMRVSNSRKFTGAKVLPLTSSLSWELLASDEESVERTVYVQFYFRNGSSEIYEDDINLLTDINSPDEEAPVVTAVRASKTVISAVGTAKISSVPSVSISTRDKLSGVVRIETKANGKITFTRVSAARRGTYIVQFPKGQRTMQIRVVDKAGNKSKWMTVKAKK